MDRIHRFIFVHRRSLAAAFAGLSVLCAVNAVQPDGVPVAVAAHAMPSGTVLASEDVRTVTLPENAVPDGASRRASAVIGRLLGGPVRAGEPLTDRRVVAPRDLSGYGIADPVLSTIGLADGAVLTALRPGDHVDIVATDQEGRPEVAASDAVVAAFGTPGNASVSVVTSRDTALRLATKVGSGALTVIARPSDGA